MEELSLPPTRMRKDVSTAKEGEENAQGQVQANEQNQPTTADMPSPFARPGSRAGTCTTPASEGGMPPIASNPFARPDSRAGFAPPEPTSPQSSVSSTSDNQLQEDVNTSVSWDLVDTDTDAEVANINLSFTHKTVTDPKTTDSINTRQNKAVALNNEKWNPQISQRIARKSLNSPPPSNESRKIRAILVKSYQSLLPICTPTFFTANLAKFAQFANTQSERREINQFRTNLNKSSILIFRLS